MHFCAIVLHSDFGSSLYIAVIYQQSETAVFGHP